MSKESEAPSILVVDDDPKLLAGIRFFLNQHGYVVHSARNAAEALALLVDKTPDLILCDVMMPDMDGFELRKRINRNPQIKDIPFIFLTARTSQADRVHGLEAGGDDYVTKPFDRKELLARINSLLRRVENSRELAKAKLNQQMNVFQKTVLSNTRHEIFTPLTWVLSGLEVAIKNQGLPEEDLQLVLSNAMTGALQLKFMLDDLLLLSAMDQNRLDLVRRPVDLKLDFIQPIVERQEYYSSKTFFLEYDIDPNIMIQAPRAEFKHVVMHLIDNAYKFSPDRSTIMISLHSLKPGGCIFTVSDQGPGIPEHLAEKVFERFFQASQGDTRTHDGLGVGLTISRAIARQLGGDVKIIPTLSGCRMQLEIPPSI